MEHRFPEGFLWGAATASHQVEGNTHNNWSEWEKKNAERLAGEAKTKFAGWQQEKFPEMFNPQNYISGRACDHYNLYEKDFDLAKSGGHNAHRFSIEWSRIEPEEGRFDQKEIEHYRKVILALRERGIEPFVTLWHWTEPIWFQELGGWDSARSINCFLRFVEKITIELKDEVKFWIVINEPNVGLGFGYLKGSQPPAKKGLFKFLPAYFNMLKAYKMAYRLIHQIDSQAKVGFAHSFSPCESDIMWPFGRIAASIAEFFENFFLSSSKKQLDFIGCNYYSRFMISLKGNNFQKGEISDLGWEIYPQGMYIAMLRLKKYDLPIYITENGLADADDSRRPEFIREHLKWLRKSINEGVDVKGYFHWSLLDNYEFPDVRGFWPRFGLIEIDYKTLERKPRESFYAYKKIIENNGLE
ncbi:MAG: glycoside hydrolase family 1 protein [Parcubacteria group bacterium]